MEMFGTKAPRIPERLGSRNFFSRRTIISNPAAVAGVLWVIAVLALFWSAFWGRNAGIAFVGLLIVLGIKWLKSK
jgi:hypothetical protein